MRIIAIANHKGGCGKTTTAINLSACLSFLRKKVLLIDLDPQGHSTCGLGIKAEFLEQTSYNLFQENFGSASDLIVSINEYLSLIPTHNVLNCVEKEWANRPDAYNCLINRFNTLTESYDYAVIDLPPNLGVLTFNALTAAEEVIVPIEPSFFSLHGLAKIFETIDSLQKARDKELRLHALMTRCDKRTKLGREIREEVRKYFKDQVFVNQIDENVRLREAAASGKSIVDFDRRSSGFRNYMGLAIEVIERGLIWQAGGTMVVASQEPTEARTEFEENANLTPESVLESLSSGDSRLTNSEPSVTLEMETAGSEYVASMPQKALGGVLFSLVDTNAKTVLIAGDFNRWIAEPLILISSEAGYWQKVIPLETGRYRYKFLVDDGWRTDSANEAVEANPYGGFDSVIQVDETTPARAVEVETVQAAV
jgi:chromosome partitioning protein